MNAFIESILRKNYDDKLPKSSSRRTRLKSQESQSTISTTPCIIQNKPVPCDSCKETLDSSTPRRRRSRLPSIICFVQNTFFSSSEFSTLDLNDFDREDKDEHISDILFVPESADFKVPREKPINFSEEDDSSNNKSTAEVVKPPLTGVQSHSHILSLEPRERSVRKVKSHTHILSLRASIESETSERI